MRRWRSRLIVEDRGKGLKPAADVAQGLAVVGKILRFLPLRLIVMSAVSCVGLADMFAVPESDCIAVETVPDAAEDCLARLVSSGKNRRVTLPTTYLD